MSAAEEFWRDLINEDDQGAVEKLVPLLEAQAAVQRVEALAADYDRKCDETWRLVREVISYDFDIIAMRIRAALAGSS